MAHTGAGATGKHARPECGRDAETVVRIDCLAGHRRRWGGGRLNEATMESERQPSLRVKNDPWNKRRLTGQKRPLKPKNVWAIQVRLQPEYRKRDLALFNLATDSKGCDLVRLQVEDVCAADGYETAPPSFRRRQAGRFSSRLPIRPIFRSTTGLPGSTRAMDSTSSRAASGRSRPFRRDNRIVPT